jgi:hypothetical protein
MNDMRKLWIRSLIAATLIGIIVGIITMYAAWDHNAGEVAYGADGIHLRSWLLIGISWFIPVFVVTSFIIGGVFSIGHWRDKIIKERRR